MHSLCIYQAQFIDKQSSEPNIELGTVRSGSVSIKEISKKQDGESQTIVNLHKLIKQHTILVLIMVIVWILLINVICIWLMFAVSHPIVVAMFVYK